MASSLSSLDSALKKRLRCPFKFWEEGWTQWSRGRYLLSCISFIEIMGSWAVLPWMANVWACGDFLPSRKQNKTKKIGIIKILCFVVRNSGDQLNAEGFRFSNLIINTVFLFEAKIKSFKRLLALLKCNTLILHFGNTLSNFECFTATQKKYGALSLDYNNPDYYRCSAHHRIGKKKIVWNHGDGYMHLSKIGFEN